MKKLTADQIHTPHWPIDSMPQLCASLGKAGADRIRNLQRAAHSPGAKERRFINPHRALMQDREVGTPGCWIDDIVQGITRLNWDNSNRHQAPLSASRLYMLLQDLEEFSSPVLMQVMAIDQRQAQRYLKAVKLIIFFINRHVALTSGSTAV